MLIKWQESSCVHLPFRNSSWNVYLKVIKKCKYLVWLCFPQKSACALALEDAQNEPTEEFCCQAVFKWGQILVMFNSTSEIWPRWWWWTLFVHEIQQYKKGPKSERNHEVLIFLHSSDNFILMFCFCAQLEQIMLIFFFFLFVVGLDYASTKIWGVFFLFISFIIFFWFLGCWKSLFLQSLCYTVQTAATSLWRSCESTNPSIQRISFSHAQKWLEWLV